MTSATTPAGPRRTGSTAVGSDAGRSGLRDLLALLHDADRLTETFVGEVQDWLSPRKSGVLVAGHDDRAGHRRRISPTGAGLFARDEHSLRRVWLKRPDLVRVELLQAGRLMRLGVRNGRTWSRWDHDLGYTSGDGSADSPVPPLLDPMFLSPARLIGLFRFEAIAEDTRGGVRVVIAHATRRDAPPEGKDISYEFVVDARHGSILRSAAFDAGRCVRSTEVLTAQFDVAVDRDRFVFREPRDGV